MLHNIVNNIFLWFLILSFTKKPLLSFNYIWCPLKWVLLSRFLFSLFNRLFLFRRNNFLLFFFTWFLSIFFLIFNFLQSRWPRFNQFDILLKLIFNASHMMLNFIFIFKKRFLLRFNLRYILLLIYLKVLTMKFSVNSNLPSDIFNFIELRNISNHSFN